MSWFLSRLVGLPRSRPQTGSGRQPRVTSPPSRPLHVEALDERALLSADVLSPVLGLGAPARGGLGVDRQGARIDRNDMVRLLRGRGLR